MAPSTSRPLLPQPASETRPPLGESGLPLIWCPHCGMSRILELISKSDENPMARFFKCPRKYKRFPLCDFYMFEEEYANFLVNYGMLQESELCHYRPSEPSDNVQAEVYEHVNPLLKKELDGVYEHGRAASSDMKGGSKKKKQGQINWMICVGVAILVLLGFNSAILLVLVVMVMYK